MSTYPSQCLQDEVRMLIIKHLSNLATELDRFEQTTHSRITYDSILDDLKTMYNYPSAYTISNFCQGVDLVKKKSLGG